VKTGAIPSRALTAARLYAAHARMLYGVDARPRKSEDGWPLAVRMEPNWNPATGTHTVNTATGVATVFGPLGLWGFFLR
jgi:hypothetical protein